MGAGHVTDVSPAAPCARRTTYNVSPADELYVQRKVTLLRIIATLLATRTRNDENTLHYDAKDKKTKHNKLTRGPKSNSDT